MEIGHVVNGYTLISEVARGGMGVVYKAHKEGVGYVAFKIVAPEMARNPTACDFARREARLCARVSGHPNTVRHVEDGEIDGVPYLVIEWLDGETLTNAITHRTERTFWDWIEIVKQVCRGIAAAQEREEVIHRDLKPDNVMLIRGRQGRVDEAKILDFGIAKSIAADATQMTAGQALGTLAWMALEQFNGESSPASDVFSLGLLLVYVLTGEQPLKGATPFQAIAERHQLAHSPLQIKGGSAALNRIVARATACLPGDRYESVAALLHDLEINEDDLTIEEEMPTKKDVAPQPVSATELGDAPPSFTQPVRSGTQIADAPSPETPMRLSLTHPTRTPKSHVAISVLLAFVVMILAGIYRRLGATSEPRAYPTPTVVTAITRDSGTPAPDAATSDASVTDRPRPRRATNTRPPRPRHTDSLPEFWRDESGEMHWPAQDAWQRLPLERRRSICNELRRRDIDPLPRRYHTYCRPDALTPPARSTSPWGSMTESGW